ncbi:hypothetical protein LINPERPRIM_LOCUS17311, partial [Linum perenne]
MLPTRPSRSVWQIVSKGIWLVWFTSPKRALYRAVTSPITLSLCRKLFTPCMLRKGRSYGMVAVRIHSKRV